MITALFITKEDTTFRIETFADEKISVTSSIQNVNDISKVFTDYSQSFTIPASDNNNIIFKHWYQNTVKNGFDQRINYNGFIEIDSQIFRTGRWRLESSSVKSGRPESYKITFFGVLKSLTDLFEDDKLSDVTELDAYSFNYSGSQVKTIIQSNSDLDVMFPLISSKRIWEYGKDDDISVTDGAIDYKELSPALKINKIFDAIASKYGLVFSGDFLTQSRFTQAFLWLKNKDVFNPLSSFIRPFLASPSSNDPITLRLIRNVTNNSWSLDYNQPQSQSFSIKTHYLQVTFSSVVNYKINIYRNNALYLTNTGLRDAIELNLIFEENVNYKFEVQTDSSVNFDTSIYASVVIKEETGFFVAESEISMSNSITFQLSLATLSPDIKVADFFSGILKMFNLTAISNDGINFNLEQLEVWYSNGDFKDFTQYSEPDFEINSVKSYSEINLEYEKSKSLLNAGYLDNIGLAHGNLVYDLGNDGSDYKIKLPFENLLFAKFTGTNLAVSYSLDKELKPYIPKPVILYKYERTGTSFYLNDGATTSLISNYNVFGQDIKYLDENHSLNFGAERSQYLGDAVNNTLFFDYYLDYLKNLYELKSRLINIKMRLPFLEIINLKLNDRIIIREKRYIINEYTTDLQTFETNFELIEDLRQ